ncbi:MAG: hypothetical protein KF878_21065 [Planctomycetes bacterium]|nr:hypothetical protein [Planctomycetota bacterium]
MARLPEAAGGQRAHGRLEAHDRDRALVRPRPVGEEQRPPVDQRPLAPDHGQRGVAVQTIEALLQQRALEPQVDGDRPAVPRAHERQDVPPLGADLHDDGPLHLPFELLRPELPHGLQIAPRGAAEELRPLDHPGGRVVAERALPAVRLGVPHAVEANVHARVALRPALLPGLLGLAPRALALLLALLAAALALRRRRQAEAQEQRRSGADPADRPSLHSALHRR